MEGVRKLFLGLVVVSVGIGGKWVGAEEHHLVGGDIGWDPSADIGSWASGRIFRVGDKIWFTYSGAQDNVVEVKSKEEYEACDVSNPIRMYTDGEDKVTLDTEGIRYFASGKPDSCKKGLKLHVEVKPLPYHEHHTFVDTVADGPTSPASSNHINGLIRALFVGLFFCYLGL